MLYLSSSFSDVDLLRETVKDWDLEFLPLKAGDFNLQITQANLDQVLIGRGKFYCKLEQRGISPVGYRTFVIPVNNQVSYYWRGKEIGANTLSLFPVNGELFSISNNSFDVMTISFRNDFFNELLSYRKSKSLEKSVNGENVWQIEQSNLFRIRLLANNLLNCIASFASDMDISKILLHGIFDSIQHSESDGFSIIEKKKLDMLRRTTKWLQDNSSTNTPTYKMYASLDLVERSVQHLFKEEIGLSPKRYQMNHRIRNVYRLLKIDGHRHSISDLAAQQGFWHFSQFAKDYKSIIGELPSETRKRYSIG